MMKRILLYIVFVVSTGSLSGQDIHFSQYLSSPMNLNPALTGLFDGEYRFVGNYRSQWGTYRTISFSADKVITNGFFNNDFVGGGITLFSDKAGDIDFRTNYANLSIAYHKALSFYANHFLSVSFQAGVGQKGFNMSKMNFDNQWDGAGHEPGLPFIEDFETDNIIYPDIGVGMAWFLAPSRRTSIYAGWSFLHLNQPNQAFYSNAENPLFRKLTVHAGGEYQVTDRLSLLPNVVFLNQGPHNQLFVGTFTRYRASHITNAKTTALYLGTYYRVGDAISIITRVDYDNISMGFSYDINVSLLNPSVFGNGGPELSLIYVIPQSVDSERIRSRPIYCPQF